MGVARVAVTRVTRDYAVVRPPLPTTDFQSSGGTLGAKTFDPFIDPERVIARYEAIFKKNSSSSATVSGSKRGPYTISGAADGDQGVLAINAKDKDGNTIATAIHVWGIASAGGGGDSTVTPPASTTNYVAADASLSNKTFSAFTDADGIIDNYNASIVSNLGNATESGTGLGPYTISSAVNGEFGVLKLDARDSSNNVVATAVHAWGITNGYATDGSQDFSPWKLLSTADIISTTDTGGLETSKGMSGNEIQFRGSVPAGASDYHPDNGCRYRFNMIDPKDNSTISAGGGSIIGIQFYLKLGSTVPDANKEFVYCGMWDGGTGGTNGSFAGVTYLSGDRIAHGTYINVSTQTYTRSVGNTYLVEIMMADDSADASGVAGLPIIKVFDDDTTPARVSSAANGNQTTTISASARPTLSFSGDIDVTIYYRLVYAPTTPF